MARGQMAAASLLLLAAVVAVGAKKEEKEPLDPESTEGRLAVLQDQLKEMAKDDRRGLFPDLDLDLTKKKQKYRFRTGDKVLNLEPIEFKRAKGKKSDFLPAKTVMTVTAVPGDTEGSIAEVEVDETGTIFDATEGQIIPKLVHEWQEEDRRKKEDALTDWAAMVTQLLTEHAPKRMKKLEKLLKAWKGREKDLFMKLRKDFKLEEQDYTRIPKPVEDEDE